MPNRILRDAILGSRAVNSLSDSGEIFYRRLMSVVDDYGRFEADHELLRARCFPRQLDRWPLSRVSEALSECGGARSSDGVPLLTIYAVPPSEEIYLQINKFDQRIRADKKGVATPSKYPAPPDDGEAPRSAASSGDSPPLALALAETKAETVPSLRSALPVIKAALNPIKPEQPDLWEEFWSIFVRAGKGLNDKDKENALKLWLNHERPTHLRIIAWCRQQITSVWTEQKFTPMPAKALRDEGWTRVAAPKPEPAPKPPIDWSKVVPYEPFKDRTAEKAEEARLEAENAALNEAAFKIALAQVRAQNSK